MGVPETRPKQPCLPPQRWWGLHCSASCPGPDRTPWAAVTLVCHGCRRRCDRHIEHGGGGGGCIGREAASDGAPKAVRQAVGGGCQSGWGRLLSVTNAVPADTCRQDNCSWAMCLEPCRGVTPPPLHCSPGGLGVVGMTRWCVLVGSRRRQSADGHPLPFRWPLSLHRRWCPSASHRPLSCLSPVGLSFPLRVPLLSLGGGGGGCQTHCTRQAEKWAEGIGMRGKAVGAAATPHVSDGPTTSGDMTPKESWAMARGRRRRSGEAGFSFAVGRGSIEPSGRTPPAPKKGSIDRTPRILPRLTRTPPPPVLGAILTPRVTFRRVVVLLRGPGQSPVLPFACCVGALRSVGRCGRCSCWCRFRVRGAPSLVCRGCAECGGMCRVRVSGAQ